MTSRVPSFSDISWTTSGERVSSLFSAKNTWPQSVRGAPFSSTWWNRYWNKRRSAIISGSGEMSAAKAKFSFISSFIRRPLWTSLAHSCIRKSAVPSWCPTSIDIRSPRPRHKSSIFTVPSTHVVMKCSSTGDTVVSFCSGSRLMHVGLRVASLSSRRPSEMTSARCDFSIESFGAGPPDIRSLRPAPAKSTRWPTGRYRIFVRCRPRSGTPASWKVRIKPASWHAMLHKSASVTSCVGGCCWSGLPKKALSSVFAPRWKRYSAITSLCPSTKSVVQITPSSGTRFGWRKCRSDSNTAVHVSGLILGSTRRRRTTCFPE
mmetsp:Transcript_19189/g.59605  ORF Transcript_19189/g.59605 Transcript_19189/m.59605 type:complete len:319 (-) Transcript_19189:763-1719(-)